MGRSKFPGKPSKHTNRKRVNVLPANGEQSESSCDVDAEGMTFVENKQSDVCGTELIQNISERCRNNRSVKFSLRRRLSASFQGSKSLKRKFITAICGNTKSTIGEKLKRAKKIPRKCYTGIKNLTRTKSIECGNLGKFVLPSRSVHSSRVIKPNKRFITVDMTENLTRKQRMLSKTKRRVSKQEKPDIVRIDPDPVKNEIATQEQSQSKVVLRQARLQVGTVTPPRRADGPFSNTANISSPSGTVTCGVCGAVRFYRFVRQARKFNIYSCESCRKFISKMIKRQTCNNESPALVCHEGQGMCHVPPIVRSQQWKLTRCAYRARCPACWLKMCLRSFQMPSATKTDLVRLLPENMRISEMSSKPWSWPCFNKPEPEKEDVPPVVREPSTVRETRSSKPQTQVAQIAVAPPASDINRQKINLKGPRVKHVCRSASIVLGQPLATFNDVLKKMNEKEPDVEMENVKELKASDNEVSAPAKVVPCKSARSESVTEDAGYQCEMEKKSHSVSEAILSNPRRDTRQKVTHYANESKVHNERSKLCNESQHPISIDFWESYDPDDISQNGFPLISSEKFPMPSICFLCGSAGREALLHCSLCCEPYHTYCLEQTPLIDNNNSRQFMWLCPRCTTCFECNLSDRTKINCQKCYKAYHPECFSFGFNTKWSRQDRPTICSKCLRCKSCGTENITKFVGNLPICISCLKLRKKGNFCPVCQKCYDENDFCIKMMECAACNKWVHSKCEGLLEEQYQILSLLPESIEYICKLCSKSSIPYWRKAVDSELKSCFNNILRQLSKNKIARNVLKWSPLNNNTPCNKAITTVKRLQFSDDNLNNVDLDNNNSAKDSINIIFSKDKSKFITLDEQKVSPVRTMLDIKNKLNSNEYRSLREYDKEMEDALNQTQSDEILSIYRSILHSVFPWYERSGNSSEDFVETNNISERDEPVFKSVEESYHPQLDFVVNDTRQCSFCKGIGDGVGEQESRLLYCGQNEWVHANCALWSSEVYEEIDGSLQNVHSAMSRGRLIRCASCKQKGASVGCCFKGCYETYHFICARNSNCTFLHDKTVYCFFHELPPGSHIISSSSDFDIRRSVYVELDKKKGKSYEFDKVNMMIGALCVTHLGKVNPSFSDDYEAVIPLGFVCSRLFWSTVEPWKLICYNITTTALTNLSSNISADRNFTIDHTLPQSIIDKKFKEVNLWQRDIDKKCQDILELDDDEEPQNGADLLSPELTDAILKELPHDLLDGISVQDIIPKLMNFEDLAGLDLSNSDPINFDLLKKLDSPEDTMLEIDPKVGRELKRSKSDIVLQMNNFDKVKERTPQRSCSLTFSCKLDSSMSPAMKKRKIMPPRENNLYLQLLQVDGAFDDSSSSECDSPTRDKKNLWATSNFSVTREKYFKLDSCMSPVTKKKKIMPFKENRVSLQLLQIDGAFDDSSSSDSDTPIKMKSRAVSEQPGTCEKVRLGSWMSQAIKTKNKMPHRENKNLQLLQIDNSSSSKCSLPAGDGMKSQALAEQPVICEKTVMNSTISPAIKTRNKMPSRETNRKLQLLQVDGAFDDSSSSECGSPTGDEMNPWAISEQPVTCEKCQCTYRTQASYKRHLDNCELLCTSESDSELVQEHVNTFQDNNCTTVDTTVLLNINESSQPVVISSFESYQNEVRTSIMNTQTYVASKSSEVISVPPAVELLVTNVPQQIEQKSVIPTILNNLPVNAINPISINQSGISEAPLEQTYTLNQSSMPINEPIPISNSTPYCVNQTMPLCVNQPITFQQSPISVNQQNSIINTSNPVLNSITINQLNQSQNFQQPMEFQSQPITVQSVPFTNNVNQPMISVASQNQINLNNKLMSNSSLLNSVVTQTVNVPTNQWIKSIAKPTIIEKTVKRGRPKAVLSKGTFNDNETFIIPSQNASTPSVIVQQLPSTNFVPAFVDTFQQQTGQNLQYIATITPQINPTIQAQPLMQLQSDGNLISLVQGMQPTMIIQQPRVVENQLVLDGNGTISWAPQPVQPVYYGFETIVQNTVMQSQQFLPTTVPGVLAANSSYSTTTQVFQTSKLEPVLDVSSNSFVLLNSGQIISTQPSIELPQYSQPIKTIANNRVLTTEVKPAHPQIVKYSVPSSVSTPTQSITVGNHSISLPTSPFVQEQGIPTNVVTPTPKPITCVQSRPMNRVLPMPTSKEKSNIIVKETQKQPDIHKIPITKQAVPLKYSRKLVSEEKIVPKVVKTEHVLKQILPKQVEDISMPLLVDLPPEFKLDPIVEIKPQNDTVEISTHADESIIDITTPEPIDSHVPDEVLQKENLEVKTDSLKLVFQKQSQDGTYKVSNNFSNKNHSVQVAPLKPIKSNTAISSSQPPLSHVSNKTSSHTVKQEKKEKKQTTTNADRKQTPPKPNESSSILYTIETQDGFKYSSTSVSELWNKVFETVQNARIAHNMPPLPQSQSIMNSLHLLGLKNNGLKYLVEQLPGVSKCSKYKPTHYFPDVSTDYDFEDLCLEHPFGGIRCAPYTKRHNHYDMFGWLSSKHRKPENTVTPDFEILPRRGSVTNLPMAMRFRQLKLTSKYSVGVYRSRIHGRGLFCLRDIEAGDMVIEYAGEVIRSGVCDKREKEYNKKGIGCYMFRIDDNLVVDATMKGNAARFINHSCDPNCYSKVVEILGHKHIIIFALRRILYSEELTYDYKFPFEEDKIPCTCGTRRCRKFLN